MGKVKKSQKFRVKAALSSAESSTKPNVSAAPSLVDLQKNKKTKKDRMKDKKEAFIQKLESSKAVIDSKKEGEHLSLIELLEGIKKEEKALTLKEKRKEEMKAKRSKKPINAQQRTKILSTGKQSFGMVLQHPQFQKNPLATIREHLKNKIAADSS